MATIVTNNEVAAFVDDYTMGLVWDEASADERQEAVDLAEDLWRSLDWKISPFDTGVDSLALRPMLVGLLAIHARHILEVTGAPQLSFPGQISALLGAHLNEPIIGPGETDSETAAQIERGRQIRLTYEERERLRREGLTVATKMAPLFSRAKSTGGTTGGGGGVDRAAVERIIDSEVFGWAQEGNTDPIPVAKLTLAGGAAIDQTARDDATRALSGLAAVRQVPSGGTQGQVLKRGAGSTYGWGTDETGGSGAVADGSITTVKLADDAVTRAKMADDSVGGREIVAEAIASGHIAGGAVTGSKIPNDAILSRHIGADQIGQSELAANSVSTPELLDLSVTEAKLAQAVRTKLNASRGANAAAWAQPGNTDLIPVVKLPRITSLEPGASVAAITNEVSGEKHGDIAFGYTSDELGFYEYVTNAWVKRGSVSRHGRTDAQLETFVEGIVSSWAISGNADGIPGDKTFDGLFKSEDEQAIPAANVQVAFNVGDATDANEVDETDAAASSFNITSQQAVEAGGFIRVRYNLTRTSAEGPLPRDIELLLQNASTGATITKHNLKDEGAGTAQFAVGDAGRKRWAVRCVTEGQYAGTVTITEATFHSSEPRADKAIEHVVHPIVSDEAEKRQEQDRFLRTEINRVEGIKAIVNGLPAATATVKKTVAFQSSKPFLQTEADAFQVPSTGFVAFIVGNLGMTSVTPVEYCRNRQEIIYAQGNHEISIEFSATGKAQLSAKQTRNNTLSSLASDAYATTNGFVMLHWAKARAGGESGGGGGGGGGGGIVQSVERETTTDVKLTPDQWADVVSASIQPGSTGAYVNIGVFAIYQSGNWLFRINRTIGDATTTVFEVRAADTFVIQNRNDLFYSEYDNPNTTESVTYTLQAKPSGDASPFILNGKIQLVEFGAVTGGGGGSSSGTPSGSGTGEKNVQSNWAETDTRSDAFILNKPIVITDAERAKLAAIAADAERNVQANWAQADPSHDGYIQNKPRLAPPNAEPNVQADWGESNGSADSFIRNKPTIPGNSEIEARIASWARRNSPSGRVPTNLLGGGGANATTFLRGDGNWAQPPSGGGGGLSQSQVDARILSWARAGSGAVIPTSKLGTGTAGSTRFLRGDGTWATVSTSGGNAASVDGYSIWTGTQAQYNAIRSKSSTTLYFITG